MFCSQFLSAESSSIQRGCNDPHACNYTSDASNNDSCEYPPQGECCPGLINSYQTQGTGALEEIVCLPEMFNHYTSNLAAAYIFIDVSHNNASIDNNDWIGAFNGDVCVGAQMWNTEECLNEVCSINVLGYSGDSYTNGYMNSGQIPTFKYYDVSEDIYYETFPSEDTPSWSHLQFFFIDSLNSYSPGCMDDTACNYDPNAYINDSSLCIYPPDGYCDCEGSIDLGCGCGLSGPSGCDNECGSNLEFDECGVCGGEGLPDDACDCNDEEYFYYDCLGICNGTAILDDCGVCNGNNMDMDDCGICNGNNDCYPTAIN